MVVGYTVPRIHFLSRGRFWPYLTNDPDQIQQARVIIIAYTIRRNVDYVDMGILPLGWSRIRYSGVAICKVYAGQ